MNVDAKTATEQPLSQTSLRPVSEFLETHFRHFNARETISAAQHFKSHVESGGKMLLAMAGAMSTAELGISLAEMIRDEKVHAISCTAANLEEDVFNLVAHDNYRICANYRDLSPHGEIELRDSGMNRVTDTCIPEDVIRHVEDFFIDQCQQAAINQKPMFPYEVFYQLFENRLLEPHYQIPISNSWLYAAYEKQLPVYSPGFEDSTLGNIFTARVMDGSVKSHQALRCGTEQMECLVNWYIENDALAPIGFFQIGGGIAGDFAICSVPLILQDLQKDIRYWQYFAQISDSTTSYGSYSGAVPNEKITWHKLDENTPRFMINSDASIVAPLIFAYVLDKSEAEMVSELDQVRNAWDQIAMRRDEYYLAADEADIEKAKSGNVEINLTPTKSVPLNWLGDLRGKEVLALACGGGRQGPLLAAAGARTTVFDLSKGQLQRDSEVATHFDLTLQTVQGDMADLTAFPDETFDLVVNPCSVCFCKDPLVIWREIARVMRPNAALISGLINPVNYLFDFFEAEKDRLVVRYVIPFDSLRQLDPSQRDRWLGDERPLEYGHSLLELLGGQLAAGLVLHGFYEDRWGDNDLLSDHLPVFFATRTVKLH